MRNEGRRRCVSQPLSLMKTHMVALSHADLMTRCLYSRDSKHSEGRFINANYYPPGFFFSYKSHSCHLSLWLLLPNCSERNGILYQLQLSMQKTADRLWLACHGSGLISPCLYLCLFSQRGRSGNHEI